MEKTPPVHLDLRAPLFYSETEELPSKIGENDDFLLFYELNPEQSRSIEPVRELFLGHLVFTGRKIDCLPPDGTARTFVLPAGNFLFTQCRGERNVPEPAEWLDIAVEQQKDGLWERYKPESKLYLRFLYEDGLYVTQFLRPL